MKEKSLKRQVEVVTKAKRKVSDTSFKATRRECANRIIHAAKYTKDEFIVYEVPDFILGYPVFDQMECVHHLIRYLRRMKMQVELIAPFTLCIAWNDNINVSDIVKGGAGNTKTAGDPLNPNTSVKNKSKNLAPDEKIAELRRKTRPSTEIVKENRDYVTRRPPTLLLSAMSSSSKLPTQK